MAFVGAAVKYYFNDQHNHKDSQQGRLNDKPVSYGGKIVNQGRIVWRRYYSNLRVDPGQDRNCLFSRVAEQTRCPDQQVSVIREYVISKPQIELVSTAAVVRQRLIRIPEPKASIHYRLYCNTFAGPVRQQALLEFQDRQGRTRLRVFEVK